MELADLVTVILCVISIVVSIIALIKNQLTQKKTLEIEARMLQIEKAREYDRQIEKKRAKITVKFKHIQKDGRYHLTITNIGAGEARNVTVALNEKSLSELLSIQPDKIPNVPVIAAGGDFTYHWKTNETPNIQAELKITWSDDSGQPGGYVTTLRHPSKSEQTVEN